MDYIVDEKILMALMEYFDNNVVHKVAAPYIAELKKSVPLPQYLQDRNLEIKQKGEKE